jgi:hypothetical protein
MLHFRPSTWVSTSLLQELASLKQLCLHSLAQTSSSRAPHNTPHHKLQHRLHHQRRALQCLGYPLAQPAWSHCKLEALHHDRQLPIQDRLLSSTAWFRCVAFSWFCCVASSWFLHWPFFNIDWIGCFCAAAPYFKWIPGGWRRPLMLLQSWPCLLLLRL